MSTSGVCRILPTTYVNVALPEAYAYHAEALAKVPGEFSDSVRSRLEMGGTIAARGLRAGAGRSRRDARPPSTAALSNCDALVLPTMPIPPQKIGATTAIIDGREEPLRPLTLRLTQLFNLTGHPAISLPCGDTREGLPCGFQLVGRRQQTPICCRSRSAAKRSCLHVHLRLPHAGKERQQEADDADDEPAEKRIPEPVDVEAEVEQARDPPVSISISALMTKMNSPSVRMMTGSDSSFSSGLMLALSRPKTSATNSSDHQLPRCSMPSTS